MDKSKQIKSLKALTILLKASNLYENDIVIWFVRLPGWILPAIYCLPQIVQLYLTYIYCVEAEFDIGTVSGSLCVSCGLTQIMLIYVCLLLKKDLMNDSIAYLQAHVNERK